MAKRKVTKPAADDGNAALWTAIKDIAEAMRVQDERVSRLEAKATAVEKRQSGDDLYWTSVGARIAAVEQSLSRPAVRPWYVRFFCGE